MKQLSFDWKLNAPLVLKILENLEYLKKRGIKFVLVDGVIHKYGGCRYSPSIIDSYNKALDVLRDESCAGTPHFEAVCLLDGVSYYEILTKGMELLARLKTV